MAEEIITEKTIDSNFEDPNEEYGFTVEDWDDDEYTAPMSIPNTTMDGKSVEEVSYSKDIPLAAMSGISLGVKNIVDAVTAGAYGLTNLALKGKFETPSVQEMQEETTVLPRSLIDYKPQSTAGAVTKEVGRIGYTTAAATVGMKGVGLTGKGGLLTNATIKGLSKTKDGVAVGKIIAPLVNGIAVDGLSFWQDEENLSSMIQKNSNNPTIKAIADYLAVEEDDSGAERAMKQALEGVLITAAAHGVCNIVKGVKNAAVYKKGLKEISNVTSDNIMQETAKTSGEIKKAVSEGHMIEPSKEILEQGERTNKIKLAPNPPVVTQAMKELQQEAEDLGLKTPYIPRAPEVIDVAKEKEKVAQLWSDYIDIDNPEDMKKFNEFISGADNQVEKVSHALKLETDTVNEGLVKLNAMKQNAMKNKVDISNLEKTNAINELLEKYAKARGVTEDAAYEGALALNTTSKDTIHKANKALLEGVLDNIDEISAPQIYDILSSATTANELASKINSLFANVKNATSKKGLDLKKLVALEQAGLMSATDTIIRNGITSVENLSLGVIDDVAESLLNKISSTAVKYGANAREFTDVFSKGAAYLNFWKESALWLLQKAKRTNLSPWNKYRQSMSRKLQTNLPKEIGKTFDDQGNIGKMMNSYVKYSGIGISEGTDNFFEASFYRGEAAARVQSQMRKLKKELNISNEQVQKIGKKMMDNLSDVDTSTRQYNVEGVNEAFLQGIEKAISKKSVEDATKMTFRSGQGKVTKYISDHLFKAPFLRMFVPFVKTSSTIMFDRFLYDRTPVGLLSEGAKGIASLFSESFKSQLSNPALRNKFLAKQAVGNGILGIGAYMYANGQITGDYPDDKGERRVWQAAGIQPNSLVLTAADGTKKYVSLNNLGILSMLLKYPAKVGDYYRRASTKMANQEKIDVEETAVARDVMATSLLVGEALAEETVLRNVSDFFTKLKNGFTDGADIDNFIINSVTNPAKNMIPRVLRQATSNKNFEEVSVNNWVDMQRKLDGLPEKYDVFGDKQERADFATGMAGISLKELRQEERYKGIMAKYGMSTPTVGKTEFPTKGHSVRLTDEQINNVYKKMGELGVGQSIKDIVESMPSQMTEAEKEAYQNNINKIYDLYKKQALAYILTEDDEVYKNYNQRIDFDMNEQYNKSKDIVKPIPSLATF